MNRILSIGLIALLLASPSFADKNADKRAKILKTRDQVLAQLYEEEPNTRKEIQRAEGYAVFSNIGVNVIFLSGGGGSGVVHDNASGGDTFMNMGSAGVGLGLGVKDFRVVFVFHSRTALDGFINSGWDFSGQADAAAKSTDKGAESSASASLVDGVSVYQITETGLALQATLQGTKYWVSDSLN